jgi:hypothetical protein
MAANSTITGYDKKLRMKSPLESIFNVNDLKGQYNTVKKTVPNAIIMDVSEEALSDAEFTRITMKVPLRQRGVMGNQFAIGQEERPVTKAVTIYRNNLRKVVTTPGYGKRKLDAQGYRLYERHIDDLARWNGEHDDLECEQAILERFGETLVWGDTAAACVRNWNPNIGVVGLPLRTMPVQYNPNRAVYTTNIVNNVLLAGGGAIAPTNTQVLLQPGLSHISNDLIRRRISRLNLPGVAGGKGYVLTYSELQAVYLGDPAWSARNLGTLYITKAALPDRVQNWAGVQGAYKDLLLVCNVRQPTLVVSGTSAPFGLAAGYVWPGDVDERNRGNANVIDTVFALGRGSMINWYPEKLHHIQQLDDYGAIVGHGTALVRGRQIPLFDTAAQSATSYDQFTSGVYLCRLPDYT